jgi:hypothetical protein
MGRCDRSLAGLAGWLALAFEAAATAEVWVRPVFVGRGLQLEMGRRKRKKQVPRCARNDSLGVLWRAAARVAWAGLRRKQADVAVRPGLAVIRVEACLIAVRQMVAGRMPHRSPGRAGTSSDRPLHAERIQRPSQAGECAGPRPIREWGRRSAAKGRVVGLGLVAGPAGVEVGRIRSADSSGAQKARTVRVRAGRGSRGWT